MKGPPAVKRVHLDQLQHIRVKLDGKNAEYPAQILDMNPDSLVLRVPETLASLEEPSKIRLMIGLKSYFWEADTEVTATYEDWWFVRRPKDSEYETSQRRDSVRIVFQGDMIAIPSDARGMPTSNPIEIKLRNLSATGCYGFMGDSHFNSGDHFMVILSLPDMPIISVLSRIMRVQKRVELGGWYGLVFQTLSTEEQEKLARFIHNQIQFKLKQGVDITLTEG
jgi:c-di-GMP-binding flagellar brake protein YcgR